MNLNMNMASNGTRALEKPTQQIPPESPKCPRCDSSNTKFCYYNNYNLSQPRHFCKACKRYWTRGGTLRNVPVGGSCRKNKKIKRSISAVDLPPPTSVTAATTSNPDTVLFGLPSKLNHALGFDPQSHMSGLRSGLSNPEETYQNNYPSSLLSSYSSLLGSTLNQQMIMNANNGVFQGLEFYKEVQTGGNMSLEDKNEERKNYGNLIFQNHMEQINPSDSTPFWNSTNFSAFLDPTNIGSSFPFLI